MKHKIITCNDGKKIRRLSRWIKIREAYDVSKRNGLYDYCTDENGYKPYQDQFDSTNGTYCNYFVFRGVKLAIDRFYSCGSQWINASYEWTENGKHCFISGVDMDGNLFHPLLIELDEYGENARVYEEVLAGNNSYMIKQWY